MAAIWAGIALAVGSTVAGVAQNRKEEKLRQKAMEDSEEGYQARLELAAEQAKIFGKQYDEAVESRPDLSWNSFIREKIAAIDDPYLRQVYTTAKEEDFERMQSFANRATKSNVSNLLESADELSGGNFREITKQRDNLVLNTTAADRMARTYELAAPLRTGASTVRYDAAGNPIAGQRADAQVFNIANEVQTAVEQEQKQDLRQLEMDRLSTAQSQQEKARDFMPFFKATDVALGLEDDRFRTQNTYQMLDEQRAWDMYTAFAQGAAGIRPEQPNYQSSGLGNELIKQGIQLGANSLSSYSKNNKDKTTSSTS